MTQQAPDGPVGGAGGEWKMPGPTADHPPLWASQLKAGTLRRKGIRDARDAYPSWKTGTPG